MIYGDQMIRSLFAAGLIEGAELTQINPASLNIRLGNTFLTQKQYKAIRLGIRCEYDEYYRHKIKDSEIMTILPGQFMLATTKESVSLNGNVAAFVQGRSSIGRIGLTVQNAGFVDPGFHGHITLELKNESSSPIELLPGYPVAQLIFFETTPVETPYHGKYNGQVEATGTRMFMDAFERIIDHD